MSFSTKSSGGNYKHKLSANEIPSHQHNFLYDVSEREAKGYGLASGGAFGNRVIVNIGNNSWKNAYPIGYTGGSQAHNNIQPYYVVYMWQRTN